MPRTVLVWRCDSLGIIPILPHTRKASAVHGTPPLPFPHLPSSGRRVAYGQRILQQARRGISTLPGVALVEVFSALCIWSLTLGCFVGLDTFVAP